MSVLKHWIRDYLSAARDHARGFWYRSPPTDYLGRVEGSASPVILIPGLLGKWHSLKSLGDSLSQKGHPVYVLDRLGYNLKSIPGSAETVRELIREKDLKNVVIVAHSKGGLIAKYVLAFLDPDAAIRKVIAVATPFGGSRMAKLSPFRFHAELRPESEIIRKLRDVSGVNSKIVSIFGVFDNHVQPIESCRLAGARNIRVEIHGHHLILHDPKVGEMVIHEAGAVV